MGDNKIPICQPFVFVYCRQKDFPYFPAMLVEKRKWNRNIRVLVGGFFPSNRCDCLEGTGFFSLNSSDWLVVSEFFSSNCYDWLEDIELSALNYFDWLEDSLFFSSYPCPCECLEDSKFFSFNCFDWLEVSEIFSSTINIGWKTADCFLSTVVNG